MEWIFVSSLFMFFLDLGTNPCFLNLPKKWNGSLELLKTFSTYLFLFFHHLIAIFLYFGFLFSNPYILGWYIIFVFVVMLHWQTNSHKCILTQVLNKVCMYSDGEPFHDIWYFLGLKSKPYTEYFLVGYLLLGISIAFYKLYFTTHVSKKHK
jgi:hypothetical protein